MNLEIIIPSDEPVRLLSAVLEELDYRELTATYSYFGRIEYSPRLLFKVVLYACTRRIYSSRGIERACREEVVEDLLYQMVQILVKHGEISFEESAVFIDGTKIEANAGRYTLDFPVLLW